MQQQQKQIRYNMIRSPLLHPECGRKPGHEEYQFGASKSSLRQRQPPQPHPAHPTSSSPYPLTLVTDTRGRRRRRLPPDTPPRGLLSLTPSKGTPAPSNFTQDQFKKKNCCSCGSVYKGQGNLTHTHTVT
ncbi:hypothetical protein E2C01_006239 [Portunus trituberculatus]|uniref:Uncharacterized protein n=1 Tax=Portunus trituberculatus TaxID=210409 RepID=A0A5B7CXC3_PORTR|nr:hypothetical protein [Portunus trituberculatus]